MLKNLFNDIPDQVYQIPFVKPEVPYEIEDTLKMWAGVNEQGQDARSNLTARLKLEDENILYNGTEDALSQGLSPEEATSFVNNHIPRYVTEDNSLEIAAFENQLNQGLEADDITYNNLQDPDTDIEDFSDNGVVTLQVAKAHKILEDDIKQHPLRVLGGGLISGLSWSSIDMHYIKNNVKSVDWGDAVTVSELGEKFNEALQRNIDSGTATEFLKNYTNEVKGLEYQYAKVVLDDILTGTSNDDIANGLGIFTSAYGTVKGFIRGFKLGGNKSAALAKIVNDPDNYLEKVPSFVKKSSGEDNLVNYPNSEIITDSLSRTVKDKEAMGMIEKYHNDIDNKVVSESDIRQVIANKYTDTFKGDYLDVTDIVQDGDNVKATVLFGNGVDGQGAMTKREVKTLAKDLGITEYKAVRKDGAGYYLQTTVAEPGTLGELSTKEFGVGAFKRAFGGSSIMPEWFHTDLLAGYRKASRMEEQLFKRYQKIARYLSNDEKKQLNLIYLMGQRANNNRGAWINVDKLYNEGRITKKVRDAYNNFRIVSDMDYIVSNGRTWNKLNKAGYVSDLEDDIVKPIKTGITKTPNYSQMIIKNGDEIITATSHSAKQVEEMLEKSGNILVEIAPISVKGRELTYTHKIISPSKLTKKLKYSVLPYRAGGRRRYSYGTNFLKIGKTMHLNGESVNAYSRVIGATNNEKQAKEVANEINKALDLAKNMLEEGDTAATAAVLARNPFKYINVSNTDDLKKLANQLDVNQRVQVLKEGESMVYDNGLRTLYEDPLDYDTSFAELSLVQGNFYSKRGSILTDFLNKEAKLVDIQDIFDQTVKRTAANNALSGLYEGMGELFKNKYIELIDSNTIRNPRTLSGIDLIRYGKLKDFTQVSKDFHQALREAKNMQLIFKRLTNVPTDMDKALNGVMRNISDTVSHTHILNDRQLQGLARSDPFSFGRAMLYQTTMGMFNLKQLWAQGMGAVTMLAAHPILFTRALLATPVVWAGYLTRESTVMRNVFKTFAKGVGIGGKMFDDMLKYFDEYGTTMGTYRSPMTEIVHTTRFLDSVGKTLRWPVEFGTNFANVTNDIAAFIEAGGKNWKKIAARADDFSMNQTRATRSAFQAGQHLPTKTIAQFTSWPHRVLESAFNKRLSTGEKFGIFAGQVALWGAIGTAISDPQNQMNINIKLREGLEGMPDEFVNLFLDGALKQWLIPEGLYTQEGIGGAGIYDSAVDIYKALTEGDTDFTLPGGFRAPTRMLSAVKAAYYAAGAIVDPDEAKVYLKEIVTDPNSPSAFRNTTKFILGYLYNEAYSSNDKLITNDMTDNQSLGMLFGLQLSESAQSQALYTIHNNSEDAVNEIFEDMVKKYIDSYNPDDAYTVRKEKLNKIYSQYNLAYTAAGEISTDAQRMLQKLYHQAWNSHQISLSKQNEKNTGKINKNNVIYSIIKTFANEQE